MTETTHPCTPRNGISRPHKMEMLTHTQTDVDGEKRTYQVFLCEWCKKIESISVRDENA